MTSQHKAAYEKALPTFKQLVGSYVYVSDDPNKVEAHIARMMGDNWREELPGEAKTPLRQKKKVRRHK